MPNLGRNEYYPWYQNSPASLPKDRIYKHEYLKWEQERIEKAKIWDGKFRKANSSDTLDEYITYIIPVELSKLLNRRINGRGFNILGTSALRNSLQFQKPAIFPEDMDLPPDYSLIRIFEPKKDYIGYEGFIEHAIRVEDYQELNHDFIYHDLDVKNKKILDLLKDNLGGDELMAQSLYSPMISSPPTMTETGGIGSCTLTPDSQFGVNINRQTAKILPPEYTSYDPPEKDVKGYNERYSSGRGKKIIYKTAEKTSNSNKHVGLVNDKRYSPIRDQNIARTNFSGEYSYLGNISPGNGREVEVAMEALTNFTQSEITLSSYDELKKADVDLNRLESSIANREDLWINIANARQFEPNIDRQNICKEDWVQKLKKDWEFFLPKMGFEENLPELAETKAEKTYENILRLGQKTARSEGRTEVSEDDLKEGRYAFTDQAERFLDTDIVKDATYKIRNSDTTGPEATITHLLRSNPCPKHELISNLTDTQHFDNKKTAEEFVQRMYNSGYIYRTPDGILHAP